MRHKFPLSWSTHSFKEVAEVITGTTPLTSHPEYYGGSIPFIGPAELGGMEPITQSPKTLSGDGVKQARLLPAEAVLVCCIGATIGKVGFSGTELATNQQINALVCDKDIVFPRYVFHYCRTLESLIRHQGASTTLPLLPKGRFQEIEIPVPTLEEQRQIAEVLDRAEELRSKRREAIAQLDTLTQAIFLEMFGDQVVNPKGWDITKVGEVADVQGGLQVSSARKKCPREVPYLRVANVYRGYLDLSEIKVIRATDTEISRTLLKKNDLLIVEGHGNPKEIGRVALWDGSITDCIHQNHIIRARFDTNKIVPLYACHYLNSPEGRQHLLKSGKTTSGLNTISVSEVRSSPVSLPPLQLQGEFACRAEAVEKLKTAHRASLSELDALFASLQHRAFRGEL